MHRDGHLGAALLAFAPVGQALAGAGAPWLAAAGALAAASLTRLPDWDLRLPRVAHRGPTHTLAFGAVVGVAGAAVAGTAAASAGHHAGVVLDPLEGAPVDARLLGFAVGALAVVAHLLADWLTPMGVPLLWPVSGRRFSLGLVAADDWLANRVLLVAGVAATLYWLWPAVAPG